MPQGRARTRPTALRTVEDVIPVETRTIGWSVLAWTADNLIQPDGPDAGKPWRYTGEQVRIVLRWYEVDESGRFVQRRGVLRRMKGWGKDPFLASIACVELCGPCRFGGWSKDGLPQASQHPAPWIQVAAVSKDQTRNTMTLFPGMFSKEAIAEYKVDLGKEIIYARGNGRIEAVTSSPRALEGGRPSLVILNESHHWVLNNDGLGMAQAINRNLGKSRDGAARAMEITNAHLPGEGSVAELTYEAWREHDGDIDGLYYDALESPPVEDLADHNLLRDGLTAARGDSTWVDVDRLIEEIDDPITPEWLARRFYLNQVVMADVEHWIPPALWEAATRKGEIPKGADVVLGFDGSHAGDCTAIVAVQTGEKPHLQVVACWENKDRDPDWRVPVLDVEEEIRKAAKRWRVREIAADPFRWRRSLEVLADERLPVVEFPQTGPRMIPATTRFHEAVVNGTMTHDDDADLARHVANARLKISSHGGQLTKDSKMSVRKIDLAVASVMAFDRASSLKKATARVINLNDPDL